MPRIAPPPGSRIVPILPTPVALGYSASCVFSSPTSLFKQNEKRKREPQLTASSQPKRTNTRCSHAYRLWNPTSYSCMAGHRSVYWGKPRSSCLTITPALEKSHLASLQRRRGRLGGESCCGETRTAPGRPGTPSLPAARRPPAGCGTGRKGHKRFTRFQTRLVFKCKFVEVSMEVQFTFMEVD